MEIIRPQAVQSRAAPGLRRGEERGVALVLGEHEAAAILHGGRDVGEDVPPGVVEDGVDGVEAEAVEMKFLHPIHHVAQEKLAHGAVVVAVEVERVAPRRVVRGIEIILRVRAEIIAVGAEVVVNRVEHHGEAVRVGGVDERAQVVGVAVGTRGRVEHHAVVAPIPAAGEIRQRHDLDGRDAEFLEIFELADGGEESAFRRERADVQFVDHQIVQREARAGVLVLPRVRAGRHDLRGTVDTLGLEARERVGKRFVLLAVEAEFIKVARAAIGIDGLEETVVHGGEFHGARDRLAIAGKQHDLDAVRARCPDAVAHAGAFAVGGQVSAGRKFVGWHNEKA